MESISIELPDEDFIHLAILAHEREMTLNDLMNQIIRENLEANPPRTIDYIRLNEQ